MFDWKANSAGPFVLVDAGNLLFEKNSSTSSLRSETNAETISHVFSRLSYDAVAVGPSDLAGGIDFIRKTGSQGIPWVSANLLDSSGKTVVQPYKKLSFPELEIVIIGLTGIKNRVQDQYSIASAETVLPALLRQLPPHKERLIIVIGSLPFSEAAALVNKFPAINVFLSADPKRGISADQVINHAVLTQTGDRGKYLGQMLIDWTGGPWEMHGVETKARLNQRLASINLQLKQAQVQRQFSEEQRQRKISLLEKLRVQVEKEIAEVDAQADRDEQQEEPSRYRLKHIALDNHYPEDPEIRSIIDEGKQQARAAGR